MTTAPRRTQTQRREATMAAVVDAAVDGARRGRLRAYDDQRDRPSCGRLAGWPVPSLRVAPRRHPRGCRCRTGQAVRRLPRRTREPWPSSTSPRSSGSCAGRPGRRSTRLGTSSWSPRVPTPSSVSASNHSRSAITRRSSSWVVRSRSRRSMPPGELDTIVLGIVHMLDGRGADGDRVTRTPSRRTYASNSSSGSWPVSRCS